MCTCRTFSFKHPPLGRLEQKRTDLNTGCNAALVMVTILLCICEKSLSIDLQSMLCFPRAADARVADLIITASLGLTETHRTEECRPDVGFASVVVDGSCEEKRCQLRQERKKSQSV